MNKSIDEQFLKTLRNRMAHESELNIKEIYSIFPEISRSTIRWRLYYLVQQGKLFKTNRGYYTLGNDTPNTTSYEYLQRKSKDIYDCLSDYGYKYYISGLDALAGELLHLPEQFAVILVVEEGAITEIQEILVNKGYIVIGENPIDFLLRNSLKGKIDIIILKGKNFKLASKGIAIKEKAFVDLYFAVTRLEYAISIPELSRIYDNMNRNKSYTSSRMRQAAKDRGVETEINWLLGLKGLHPKALEFMEYLLKERI